MSERSRAIYMTVGQVRLLDHWCNSLRASFRREVFLVGSTLYRPDWRDVDVRIALTDEEIEHLPMHRLDFHMAMSMWGERATGLPIDFQIQSHEEFQSHDGMVNPRGYIEERRTP